MDHEAYLSSFHEQITINHKPITDKEISEILVPLSKKIEVYQKEHEVKWFEITTSIALIYFANKKCDFVVMEAGLGGLNDCTNIISSDISIITSIGYDHMDLLGNTIGDIASHKAGIIKEHSHTICQEDCQGIAIIRDTCQKKHTILHEIKKADIKAYGMEEENQVMDYKEHSHVLVNLKGKKQLENASICLECMDILRKQGYSIPEEAIAAGLKQVVHPGRLEQLCASPKILFDGGHNPQAIMHVIDTLAQYDAYQKKCYIFSILKTKDYETVLKLLLQDKEAVFLFTDGNDSNRYVAKEELYQAAKAMDGSERRIKAKPLREAIAYAYQHYKDRVIGIIGSFYIYSDVKEKIQELMN